MEGLDPLYLLVSTPYFCTVTFMAMELGVWDLDFDWTYYDTTIAKIVAQ